MNKFRTILILIPHKVAEQPLRRTFKHFICTCHVRGQYVMLLGLTAVTSPRCWCLAVRRADTCYQWHLHHSRSAWVSSGSWSQWTWGPASHTECLCSPSSSPSDWPPELYLWTAVRAEVIMGNRKMSVLASFNNKTIVEMHNMSRSWQLAVGIV